MNTSKKLINKSKNRINNQIQGLIRENYNYALEKRTSLNKIKLEDVFNILILDNESFWFKKSDNNKNRKYFQFLQK